MLCSRPKPREAHILSPDQRDALPPLYRLEGTVLHLQDRGDVRTLIGFVEAWAKLDEPSTVARIAQSRALVQLGLVDRAWARLQSLAEADGASAEVLELTVDMFVVRQWPKRARKMLNRGMAAWPDDSRLKVMWERLSEPQTEPDLGALDNDEADISALLTTAHHLIATGSHTRARTLLERARKRDSDSAATADMLWALDGDFDLDGTLAELAAKYGPDLGTLADLEEEPDHTESASPEELGVEDRDPEAAGFPNLFREQGARTEMHSSLPFEESDEITKVSSLMDLAGLDTLTDDTGSGEYTEIQRVITKDPQQAPDSEPAFDLSSLSSDLDVPEIEDDDVVVLTRQDDEHTETEIHPSSDLRDEDLILEAEATPPASRGRQQPDEAETWVLPAPEPEEPELAPQPVRRKPAPASNAPWWMAAMIATFAAAAVVFALLILLRLFTG